MRFEELLRMTIAALESEGVPYMVTGSVASSFHGEFRSTRDIDIVIDPSPSSLDQLVDRLRAGGMYVDRDAARSALRDRGQFNAVLEDAKVDLIVRKDRPFSITEFERRGRVRLFDIEADMATVEDMILTKLVWAQELDSERQLRDVAGMLSVSGDAIDRGYVETWATRLGVADAWHRLEPGA